MKLKLTIVILVLVQSLSAQKIFDFVLASDYDAVKNYEGPVNLRDTNQATPLMWAVFASDLKMVKLLIDKGSDVTMKGWITFTDPESNFEFIYGSCLAIAAGENKKDLVKYFIEKLKISVEDKEINLYQNIENGWNALQWASVKGNNEIIEYLIKKGANINTPAQTDMNQTSLILAIIFDKPETAILLTELGADVNQRDDFGVPPIAYAIELQNPELVRTLLKHGATYKNLGDETFENSLKVLLGVDDLRNL